MQSGVSIHRKDHAELRSILMNIKPHSKRVRRSKGRRAGRRGHTGSGCCGQNSNVSLDNHNRANKMPPHFSRKGPGLSRLRVHELQLRAGGHPAPVASLGLHLVLDGAD